MYGSRASQRPEIKPVQRILALDVGLKRIGLAISDPLGSFAVPSGLVERTSDEVAISKIADIVVREEIGAIVVGMPLSLDGSLGPQAQDVRGFIEKLRAGLTVSIQEWDERFSTAEAERLLHEAGYKSRNMKQRKDTIAAAVILQAYLDHRRTAAG